MDYSNIGISTTNSFNKLYEQAQKNAPDFTQLANTANDIEFAKQEAVIDAQHKINRQGLISYQNKQTRDAEQKLREDVKGIMEPAQRFAGVVAGLGAIGGGAVAIKNMNEDQREQQSLQDQLDKLSQERRDFYSKQDQKSTDLYDRLREQLLKPEAPPVQSTTLPTTNNTIADQGGSTSTNQNVGFETSSGAFTSTPGQRMSQDQITNLAIATGFSPQAARVVSAISGGESGFDPSNSTKRSGLYAQTGEDSVGLMQINWGYHKDSGWLQRLGITKREDLFDPVKNMKAAKYLYDGRGGNFDDWTVYTSGEYQKYLR